MAEKIRPPQFSKSRKRASCASPMANPMIRVRSQGAVARCSSCTNEASRMWSAVCSRTSTGDRRLGAKMMPGGGIPRSKARIAARSASEGSDRQAPRAGTDCDPRVAQLGIPSQPNMRRGGNAWPSDFFKATTPSKWTRIPANRPKRMPGMRSQVSTTATCSIVTRLSPVPQPKPGPQRRPRKRPRNMTSNSPRP